MLTLILRVYYKYMYALLNLTLQLSIFIVQFDFRGAKYFSSIAAYLITDHFLVVMKYYKFDCPLSQPLNPLIELTLITSLVKSYANEKHDIYAMTAAKSNYIAYNDFIKTLNNTFVFQLMHKIIESQSVIINSQNIDLSE